MSDDAGQRQVALIVAMDRNRVIGHEGKLPWHLPADLKRFKALTMGHHIIMGRKTWESIGRPLPGRTSIVISRNSSYSAPGAVVVDSLAAALAAAGDDATPFVIGGAEIFRTAIPYADHIYLTLVGGEYPGSVHFPELEAGDWRLQRSEHHAAEGDVPQWDLCVYERIAPERTR